MAQSAAERGDPRRGENSHRANRTPAGRSRSHHRYRRWPRRTAARGQNIGAAIQAARGHERHGRGTVRVPATGAPDERRAALWWGGRRRLHGRVGASGGALMPRVLLLEDDASLGRTLAERLEKEKLTVHWAQTIADARTQLAAGTWDLAVLDVRLPDGSGF